MVLCNWRLITEGSRAWFFGKRKCLFPCIHDSELNQMYFSLSESINICGTSTGLKVYKYKLCCLFLFLLPPGRVSSSFQRIECWFQGLSFITCPKCQQTVQLPHPYSAPPAAMEVCTLVTCKGPELSHTYYCVTLTSLSLSFLICKAGQYWHLPRRVVLRMKRGHVCKRIAQCLALSRDSVMEWWWRCWWKAEPDRRPSTVRPRWFLFLSTV